jgi:hypothetical protein
VGGLDCFSQVKGKAGGRPAGRLGLLLYDNSNSNVIALTAAQVARGVEMLQHSGVNVAEPSADNDRSLRHLPLRPAETMIEKIALLESTRINATPIALSANRKRSRLGLCAELHKQMGRTVLIHTSPAKPARGLLKSVYGHFRMVPPDAAEAVLFSEALTIESLDGKPLTKAGDAGAVVTTLTGEALGIVICGIGTTCFAAPVRAAIPQNGSQAPITTQEVDLWNETADRLAHRPKAAPPQRSGLFSDVQPSPAIRRAATSDDEQKLRRVSRFIQEHLFAEAAE